MHLKECNVQGWTGLFWLCGQLAMDDVVVRLNHVFHDNLTNHYSHFSAVRRHSAYAGRSVCCLYVRVVSTYITGAKWHRAIGSKLRELLAACPWWSRRVQLWGETDMTAVLRSFIYSAEVDLRCYVYCRSLLCLLYPPPAQNSKPFLDWTESKFLITFLLVHPVHCKWCKAFSVPKRLSSTVSYFASN